jgi:hypothetical protein
MRRSSLAIALLCGCNCGPPKGAPDAGPIEDYFGVVRFKCLEYVIGTQPKTNFDLGVVDYQDDSQALSCPWLIGSDAGTPVVHVVNYYSGTLKMIDYFYFAGNELRQCRRDFYSVSGDTYYYKDDGLTFARDPAVGNDRIQSTALTEVRDPNNAILYTSLETLTVDTLDSPGLAVPFSSDGGIDTVRYIHQQFVADGGAWDGGVVGTKVGSESRYVAPGVGWAGLDLAVDAPQGVVQQYRLQGVRIIQSEAEALSFPCGGRAPDGG